MSASDSADPYDLNRFLQAQQRNFETAIDELRSGQKRSHWMWYVFPQLAGLGTSSTARYYAISGRAEATAYLAHPQLGPRLRQAAEAVLAIEGKSAREILGSPDDLKLRSSATLFDAVSSSGNVFSQVLDRFYDGQPDLRTLQLLDPQPKKKSS